MHASYNLGDSDSDDEGVDDVGKSTKEESNDVELLSNITKLLFKMFSQLFFF